VRDKSRQDGRAVIDWPVAEPAERQRQIAIYWAVEDVQAVRPDLDDAQAMEVLQDVRRRHGAARGVTWTTLEDAALELFGEPSDEAAQV